MSAPDFVGNSGGIWSQDDNIQPATIALGGTVTAGNVVNVSITVGSATYPFAVTAASGDTLQKLLNDFIAAINANTTLAGLGITSNQGTSSVMAFSFLCRRNGTPLPTVAANVSSGSTITVAILAQPYDILDAGPIWYMNRTTSQPPKAGDCVGYLPFNSGHSGNVNPSISYALIIGEVGHPTVGYDLQGRMHLHTAGYNPPGGHVMRRFTIEKGMIGYDATPALAAGGDKGVGTINVPGGYYVNGVNVRQRDSFKATKGGVDQTGIVDGTTTPVTFGTVGLNVGVPYDAGNSRWTPPPGVARISAQVMWNNVSANIAYLFIMKNGVTTPIAGRAFFGNPSATPVSLTVDVLDYATGNDYYDCRVLIIAGSGTHTISGQPFYSWFEGHQV